ncbi:MAG: hypothetical protein ACPGWS_09080 [Solirubrobacterales bacterium]
MKRAISIASILAVAAFASSAGSASANDMIDCVDGGAMPFSLAAFSNPPNAEQGTSSEAAALRSFLATHGVGQQLPQSGWFELARKTVDANDYVRFGHGTATNFKNLLFFRVAGRAWQWHATFGQGCSLRTMATATRTSTPWNVDPKRLPRNPRSRVVWVQMTEKNCASGQPADGRAHVPVIRYSRSQILMIATIEPAKGSFTCQDNPPTYVRVVLARPIGRRALVDGGSVPTNSRLNRTQLKRIRARKRVRDVLIFQRTQNEICRDKSDGSLTIPGLRLTARLQRRLDSRASKCSD